MIWKNKIFWSLAFGGLIAYVLMFFLGIKMGAIGSLFWLTAFVYLIIKSIENWSKGNP